MSFEGGGAHGLGSGIVRRVRRLLAAAITVQMAIACAGDAGGESVLVFAAASLTEALREVGAAFEAETGTLVEFNFAGTPQLLAQLREGARADVVATADEASMSAVSGAVAPRVFARNRLEIVVERGNPLAVRGLADLSRVKVALPAADVPAGRYAREVLHNAGVEVAPASLETSVRGVVSKVALGEVDAGIVYVTDVRSARDRVEGVAIPESLNITAAYPIAPLAGSKPAASAFADFAVSPSGWRVLERYGFFPP